MSPLSAQTNIFLKLESGLQDKVPEEFRIRFDPKYAEKKKKMIARKLNPNMGKDDDDLDRPAATKIKKKPGMANDEEHAVKIQAAMRGSIARKKVSIRFT